jgi:hypothetical protein
MDVITQDAQDIIVRLISTPDHEGQAIAEKAIEVTNHESSVPLELKYNEEIVNFYQD